MDYLALALGLALFVVATVLRRRSLQRSPRPILTAVAIGASLVIVLSSVASATHTEVTTTSIQGYPSPWNGYKVYLSAPTHGDSGSRGECGWEENINGRHWSYYAGFVFTGGGYGSFYNRQYNIYVSNNPRVETEYVNHVAQANNWGANIYIVTHTNASGGCASAASYLLVMFKSSVSNSVTLKNQLLYDLDPVTPGGQNSWDGSGFYEIDYPNASYRAYVELFFHDNTSAKNWFQGDGSEGSGGVTNSWKYGAAVDAILNYPRGG